MTTPLRVNKNCARCGKYVFRIGSFPTKEPKKELTRMNATAA